MTDRRASHPAAASRVVAAGMSTATAFALVAGMAVERPAPRDEAVLAPVGASSPAATSSERASGVTPDPVVVVIRRTQGTPVPLPRPSAAPGGATPAPVTRSDGS
ncbi:hypothetical protein [Salsipaludibacter albus]|uniref:hypothetical protein n=1 Tax=Salsipaludibacter albus TaxID=2849650 RepID=UPI001EE460A3|nr:hypothetical protein [Salsipaludibacter albus]MBY5163583.1 hypothetical protein [Salsipaludibacter albus]